jgi:hypothetical protein
MQILVLAASAAALCVGSESRAWARQTSAPVLDSVRPEMAPWPAPVGHRQSGRKDLPSSMREDEEAITAGQRNVDDSLTICHC